MDEDGAEVADLFAQLAVELSAESGVEETVGAVLRFAQRTVRCTSAGLLLASHGRLETYAVTDPAPQDCGRLQLDTGQGPALDVVAGAETVVVTDLGTEERWPDWTPKALAAGVRSQLDLRLATGTTTLGVLELISTEPAAFGTGDGEGDGGAAADPAAWLLARHASVALAGARQEETLWQAIDARKLIGQAQGILMERFRVDDDQAFAILRRYSQNGNVKLRDVAQQLIETRRLPG